jgi:hypothetical protein
MRIAFLFRGNFPEDIGKIAIPEPDDQVGAVIQFNRQYLLLTHRILTCAAYGCQ